MVGISFRKKEKNDGVHVKEEIHSQSLKIYHINEVDVIPISLKGQRQLDPPRLSPFVVPTTTPL